LFRLAAAVVTETGGVLSHAAIVAREFGIPAVAGADRAMARLTDGAPVTVDGSAGTVRRACD
jgi:pyruvate,water dikinase